MRFKFYNVVNFFLSCPVFFYNLVAASIVGGSIGFLFAITFTPPSNGNVCILLISTFSVFTGGFFLAHFSYILDDIESGAKKIIDESFKNLESEEGFTSEFIKNLEETIGESKKDKISAQKKSLIRDFLFFVFLLLFGFFIGIKYA